MECPHCRHSLVSLEFAGLEIDYCPSCRGVWLDEGELELLRERPGAPGESVEDVRPARTKARDRRCPVCGKLMPKVLLGRHATVLDRCERHGIWFDHRELREVLGEGSPGPLVGLLDEMLASDRA